MRIRMIRVVVLAATMMGLIAPQGRVYGSASRGVVAAETWSSPQEWQDRVLAYMLESSPELWHAVDYILENDVQLMFKSQTTVAMWSLDGNIYISSRMFSLETRPNHPTLLALIAHEVKHLEQGPIRALSVYGELEAWQMHCAVYRGLIGIPPGMTSDDRRGWDELSQIRPSYSRTDLDRVAELMQKLGGPGYLIPTLPLWPLPEELEYPYGERLLVQQEMRKGSPDSARSWLPAEDLATGYPDCLQPGGCYVTISTFKAESTC